MVIVYFTPFKSHYNGSYKLTCNKMDKVQVGEGVEKTKNGATCWLKRSDAVITVDGKELQEVNYNSFQTRPFAFLN